MSEDRHKQPDLKSFQPQTPPLTAAQQQEKREQPLLKTLAINTLRGTIGLLEGVVEKLETEPVREIPPSAASSATTSRFEPASDTVTAILGPELESSVSEEIVVDTSAETPEPVLSDTPSDIIAAELGPELESSVSEEVVADTPTVTPKPVAKEPITERISQPAKPGLFDRLFPSFDKLQAFWDGILTKIRSLLPAAWNEKLSDWAITGAIAGIIVIVLWTTVALVPDTPEQVAKSRPKPIETPPELTAPEAPQPVAPAPPPQPDLTPEQSLIAAVQQQVTEITEEYGNGMIQSVEANFLSSRLIVKVSDRWYELAESEQNKLADEILRRSRELDFSKLEIADLDGTLLARSPVVGSNMVILKREELAAKL